MTDFNGFVGPGRRLEDRDFLTFKRALDVDEDTIRAFLEVEAAGSGFDSAGRPKMLFEPHVFYRNLSVPERTQAVEQGLAYKRWGQDSYPSDSYPRLLKAMLIDETAALRSASWGIGQVLGENHVSVGYRTPQQMVLAAMQSEEDQVHMMLDFIVANSIDDDLRARRWDVVARIYNGPGYAAHGYHTRLAAAYRKWKKIPDIAENASPAVGVLQIGDRGPLVKTVQNFLKSLGYAVGKVDGKFGSLTRAAVLAFQAENDIPTTGVVDADTWAIIEDPDALEDRRRTFSAERHTATLGELRESGSSTVKAADAAQAGGGAVVGLGVLGSATAALQEAKDASGVLGDLVTTLTPLTDMLKDNWFLLFLALGGFVVWRAGLIKSLRLKDHQTGKNLGR